MSIPNISLVLPCYNEAEHFNKSIAAIESALKKLKINYEIILVDDNSSDETKSLIKAYLRRKKSHVHVIYHTRNLGRGKTVMDGIKKARGSIVGFIDIDCEISPQYIGNFYSKIYTEKYDVVCAHRFYPMTSSGIVRALASKMYAFLFQILYTMPLSDTEAGYKFFNAEKVKKIIPTLHYFGWFWDTEVMVRSYMIGYKIGFIPVAFNRRSDKTSTVHLFSDSIEYLFQLFKFRHEISQKE